MSSRSYVGVVAVLLAACGTELPTWPEAVSGRPVFNRPELLLAPGDTTRVGVHLAGFAGDTIPATVLLVVRDTTVVLVEQDGYVRARDVGSTYLVAVAAGYLDSIAVTVGVRFVALSAGASHVCGITASEGAFCWGANDFGKLGSGLVPSQPTPTRVAGLTTATDVAGGDNHSCWLDGDGAAWCQGGGSMTIPVGLDSVAQPLMPARIATSERFVSLRSGAGSTCGLNATGALWCWGANTYGEAGTGTRGSPIGAPIQAHPGRTFVSFDLGEHNATCGVQADGIALCWGHNDAYQLGREPRSSVLTDPEPISGDLRWQSVEIGLFHGCGVTVESIGFCWGGGGRRGDGDTSTARVPDPRPVAGSHRWRMIAVGWDDTCGLQTDGTAWCWGPLPDTVFVRALEPQPVPTSLHFTTLVAGRGYACGLATEGRVWCWGSNSFGVLGRRDAPDISAEPVLVANQLGPLTDSP